MARKKSEFFYIFFILFFSKYDFIAPAAIKDANKKASVGYFGAIEEIEKLAQEYNAIDLGPGTPDFEGPEFLRNALESVTSSNDPSLQETYKHGHPKLLQALSNLYGKVLNQKLDPTDNIIITSGATEALQLTIDVTTGPGDEWIIIEPYFELYASMIRKAGGIVKFIPLKPTKSDSELSSADWTYDREELEKLFNENTKAVLLNNPQNPTGKVFSQEELQHIANLAIKWDAIIVTDEVYEWTVFDNNHHKRIATLPGMFERTITISSASKAFAVPNWRIGWTYASEKILSEIKSRQTKVTPTPIQVALAIGLEQKIENFGQPGSFIVEYAKELEVKRDFMVKVLKNLGMKVTIPESGYFILCNWSPLADKVDLSKETDPHKDFRFVKWMIKNKGIAGIPMSAFYGPDHIHDGEELIRFAFVKKQETLNKAEKVFSKWASELSQ